MNSRTLLVAASAAAALAVAACEPAANDAMAAEGAMAPATDKMQPGT